MEHMNSNGELFRNAQNAQSSVHVETIHSDGITLISNAELTLQGDMDMPQHQLLSNTLSKHKATLANKKRRKPSFRCSDATNRRGSSYNIDQSFFDIGGFLDPNARPSSFDFDNQIDEVKDDFELKTSESESSSKAMSLSKLKASLVKRYSMPPIRPGGTSMTGGSLQAKERVRQRYHEKINKLKQNEASIDDDINSDDENDQIKSPEAKKIGMQTNMSDSICAQKVTNTASKAAVRLMSHVKSEDSNTNKMENMLEPVKPVSISPAKVSKLITQNSTDLEANNQPSLMSNSASLNKNTTSKHVNNLEPTPTLVRDNSSDEKMDTSSNSTPLAQSKVFDVKQLEQNTSHPSIPKKLDATNERKLGTRLNSPEMSKIPTPILRKKPISNGDDVFKLSQQSPESTIKRIPPAVQNQNTAIYRVKPNNIEAKSMRAPLVRSQTILTSKTTEESTDGCPEFIRQARKIRKSWDEQSEKRKGEVFTNGNKTRSLTEDVHKSKPISISEDSPTKVKMNDENLKVEKQPKDEATNQPDKSIKADKNDLKMKTEKPVFKPGTGSVMKGELTFEGPLPREDQYKKFLTRTKSELPPKISVKPKYKLTRNPENVNTTSIDKPLRYNQLAVKTTDMKHHSIKENCDKIDNNLQNSQENSLQHNNKLYALNVCQVENEVVSTEVRVDNCEMNKIVHKDTSEIVFSSTGDIPDITSAATHSPTLQPNLEDNLRKPNILTVLPEHQTQSASMQPNSPLHMNSDLSNNLSSDIITTTTTSSSSSSTTVNTTATATAANTTTTATTTANTTAATTVSSSSSSSSGSNDPSEEIVKEDLDKTITDISVDNSVCIEKIDTDHRLLETLQSNQNSSVKPLCSIDSSNQITFSIQSISTSPVSIDPEITVATNKEITSTDAVQPLSITKSEKGIVSTEISKDITLTSSNTGTIATQTEKELLQENAISDINNTTPNEIKKSKSTTRSTSIIFDRLPPSPIKIENSANLNEDCPNEIKSNNVEIPSIEENNTTQISNEKSVQTEENINSSEKNISKLSPPLPKRTSSKKNFIGSITNIKSTHNSSQSSTKSSSTSSVDVKTRPANKITRTKSTIYKPNYEESCDLSFYPPVVKSDPPPVAKKPRRFSIRAIRTYASFDQNKNSNSTVSRNSVNQNKPIFEEANNNIHTAKTTTIPQKRQKSEENNTGERILSRVNTCSNSSAAQLIVNTDSCTVSFSNNKNINSKSSGNITNTKQPNQTEVLTKRKEDANVHKAQTDVTLRTKNNTNDKKYLQMSKPNVFPKSAKIKELQKPWIKTTNSLITNVI